MKDKKLGAVSGVETLRVLAGTVGTASFTVNSLAQRTGVSRETVDTVLRRYLGAFQKLDPVTGRGRGRPQVRWQLRSDAIDEVVAEVGKLQSIIGAGSLKPTDTLEPDLVEASLTLAADAVLQASVDDPQAAMSLTTAAKSSLRAAGYDYVARDLPSEGLPETDARGYRARIIGAVADLVEAEISGNYERIDAAQVKALPLVIGARSSMSAEEWLPLANRIVCAESTVLAAPVEVVDQSGQILVEQLFPNLATVSDGSVDIDSGEGNLVPIITSILADRRVVPSALGTLLPSVVLQVIIQPATAAVVTGLLRRAVRRPTSNIRPIAKRVVYVEHVDSPAISAITGGTVQLVLVSPERRHAQTDFARVVNRAAVGLDASIREPSLLIKN